MMPSTPISRRTVLTVLGSAGVAGLVGCDVTRTPRSATAATLPDALLVEVAGGLEMLRGSDRRPVPRAVATDDGRVAYASEPAGADTAFWRVDTATGRAGDRRTLPGRWVPRAISATGALVALTPEGVPAATGRPVARTETPVLITDGESVRHRLKLRGNFVPETFTNDLSGLFVLEWLPADAPDRYRVRVVDLATGTPGPLSTRAKVPVPPGAEEEMRGDGRQAVLAPTHTVLYTLYTHQPDHQHTRDLVSGRPASDVHAFVHTLHLAESWAYCVDLPHPFGTGPADGHAMAMFTGGERLVVADVTSGTLADISTQNLTVDRTATMSPLPGAAHAAADQNRLFVAAGTTVSVVDPAHLGVAATWSVREAVTGLVSSPDGERLYVGQSDVVSWHDPDDGREIGRIAAPGLVRLRGLAGRG
ncbi:YncE family protein [Plantactinospora sp. GCM10030261]|uniref:YncE family protein n=1 Tax=Plantactinospora sp. GCM10030261 TaxID=3273420 RepID=UPI00360D5725